MKPHLFVIVLFVIFGCKSPSEKASIIITNEIDTAIGGNIKTISKTLYFYYYGNPSNYWYDEVYGYSDILKDRFEYGTNQLNSLDNQLNFIVNSVDVNSLGGDGIHASAGKLHKEIKKTKKEIHKKVTAIDMAEYSIFGGASGLMAFSNMMVGPEEQERMDMEAAKIPNNIEEGIYEFHDCISTIYAMDFFPVFKNFENRVNSSVKSQTKDKIVIREIFTTKIKSILLNNYDYIDTTYRTKMINDLIKEYENFAPIENAK
jgi:hypothetical protein